MDNTDLKLDVKAMLIDLNNLMNQDFSVMDDDELDTTLSRIVYKEEKLVYNLIDWSLSKLHLLTPAGLKSVNDLRSNLTTMSPEALKSIDPIAPIVMETVIKLDAIDRSGRMASVLLKALSL